MSALAQDIMFAICGLFVSFVWMEDICKALLALADIAQSVRASAVIAVEQDERLKAKAKAGRNGKSLGLQRVRPKQKRSA